jgi:electron transport complex protein RnfA
MSLFSIFINSIFTDNIVLTKFLGICSFIGTSNKKNKAIPFSICLTITVVLSSIITYFIYNYILVLTKTEYLKTIIFILVIASLVQMIEIIIKNKMITLYKKLGIYLPLITTNCAVLGTNLLTISNNYNFVQTLVFSIGSSLGFFLVIYIMSSLRERMDNSNTPKCFKGYPISFITAAIMCLLFSRF